MYQFLQGFETHTTSEEDPPSLMTVSPTITVGFAATISPSTSSCTETTPFSFGERHEAVRSPALVPANCGGSIRLDYVRNALLCGAWMQGEQGEPLPDSTCLCFCLDRVAPTQASSVQTSSESCLLYPERTMELPHVLRLKTNTSLGKCWA